MRELTGSVDGEANAMQQLRQRLGQVNSDIEVRLGELNSGPGRAPAGVPPPPMPGALSSHANAEGFLPGAARESSDLPGTTPPGALLPPPDQTGTLTPPEPPGPGAMAAVAGAGPRPP